MIEFLSFLVLILLSLVGYSAGAVGKAGKVVDLKPQIFDLFIITFIWTAAVYSRLTMDLNKWLLILIWLMISSFVGMLTFWIRRLSKEKISDSDESNERPSNLIKRLWQRWEDFSKRMGSFQSRIILSLFFFIFITPFGLGVRIFSDPLNIKWGVRKSYWLTKKSIKVDEEQLRRQF